MSEFRSRDTSGSDPNVPEIQSGALVLKEHEEAKWLSKETLYSVDWLPADATLIEKIRLGM